MICLATTIFYWFPKNSASFSMFNKWKWLLLPLKLGNKSSSDCQLCLPIKARIILENRSKKSCKCYIFPGQLFISNIQYLKKQCWTFSDKYISGSWRVYLYIIKDWKNPSFYCVIWKVLPTFELKIDEVMSAPPFF